MAPVRRRPWVLTFATALLLASCGGKEDQTGGQSTTTASGPTTSVAGSTSSSSVEGTTDAKAKAEGLVARKADLPDDFTESPRTSEPLAEAAGKELAACVGLPDPATVNETEVAGPLLTKGEFMQVSSTATVLKTVEAARDDLAAVTGPKFQGCLRDQIANGLRDQLGGPALKEAKVESIDVGRFGDATVGTRVTLTVEIGAQSLSAFQDTVLLVKGRFEVAVNFVNFNEPFDPAVERSLVARIGERLEALE